MACVKSIDRINLILVLISCAIAHIVPIEALVISYAFLGPAHYLTEISWLHDRKYFIKQEGGKHKDDVIILSIFGLVALIVPLKEILMLLFFLALSMAFTANWWYRLGATLLCMMIFVTINSFTTSYMFFLLLPTIVHVFIFTSLFVLLGALKNNSIYGYLTLLALIASAGSFFLNIVPDFTITEYAARNLTYMSGIYDGFAELIGFDPETIAQHPVSGFVGFAYTYHYLNWFSKTRVIGWNDISPKRRGVIIVLYLASISIYLYNYSLGFKALLLLSFMHVVLEFPLNGVSFAQIVILIRKRALSKAG